MQNYGRTGSVCSFLAMLRRCNFALDSSLRIAELLQGLKGFPPLALQIFERGDQRDTHIQRRSLLKDLFLKGNEFLAQCNDGGILIFNVVLLLTKRLVVLGERFLRRVNVGANGNELLLKRFEGWPLLNRRLRGLIRRKG